MVSHKLTEEQERTLLKWQKDELTGHETYKRLSGAIKDEHNSQVIADIAETESAHYAIFRAYTGKDVAPSRFKALVFYLLARVLGLTFGIKLMERGEEHAQAEYASMINDVPELASILADEEAHEEALLGMLDEEALKYTGSVVLGLNDALVELTGTLAGLTFAFQNTQLIALSGLITGISASLSMAASEYLSARADEEASEARRSALYTGLAYVFTVTVLILPYLLFENYMVCLALTLVFAVLVIAFFNFYISVAKDLDFRKRFTEMATISIGVAVFSFLVGVVVRQVFGIEV